jgi:hypothetical protein
MTRDDIIRMAREAGIKLPDGAFPERGSFALPELLELARLSYSAGAAAERERLARLAESQEDDAGYHSLSAAEIRAGRIGAEGRA